MINNVIKQVACYPLSLLFIFLITASINSVAGVMTSSTRLVFQQGDIDKSLMLVNTNNWPVIVQAWVDDGEIDSTPESADAPFLAIPAVFYMGAGGMQGIRVIYNQRALPSDRESVAWLNVYEVPPTQPKSAEKAVMPKVSVVMNTQMKVFYRPSGLKRPLGNIDKQLAFSLEPDNRHWQIVVKNNSPYYASFSALGININKQDYNVESQMDMMAAPFSEKRYRLIAPLTQQDTQLYYALINDDGQVYRYKANVSIATKR